MTYQLFDARCRIFFGPPVRMTEAQAILANRDLFLAGKRNIGYKPIDREPPQARATPKPAHKPAHKPALSPELIDALIAVGYTKTKAKELAATAPAGSTDEQLTVLFQKVTT